MLNPCLVGCVSLVRQSELSEKGFKVHILSSMFPTGIHHPNGAHETEQESARSAIVCFWENFVLPPVCKTNYL